jgi:hypothetical protein
LPFRESIQVIIRALILATVVGSLVPLGGCDHQDVRSYRVPKATEAQPAKGLAALPAGSMPAGSTTAADAKVIWTVPEDWKAVEKTQSMRLATLDAAGAEVSIAAFPGAVGGPLANINRWRGQIGLEPTTEAQLPSMVRTSMEGTTEVSLVSMVGSEGQVMLAAVIIPGDGQSWFVKTITNAAKADEIRPAFEQFAKSFRLEGKDAAPAGSASSGTPAAPTPGADTNPHQAPVGGIEARLASWTPPANWTREAPSSGFITAAFKASNAEGGTLVTASSLLNDGGGLLANINRWRDQLGLPPLGNANDQPLGTVGPGSAIVDLVNADGTDRMIVGIVRSADTTWFFKSRGSPKGVEADRAGFEGMVKAVGLGTPP